MHYTDKTECIDVILENNSTRNSSKNHVDCNEIGEGKDNMVPNKEMRVLDCCGLQCPGPIMKVNETMQEMKNSEVLQVSATDMGFASDIDSWCRRTGNTLVKVERKNKENIVYIKKGSDEVKAAECNGQIELPQGKTIVVFSGDLDKVLASFIIANGAAAMGRQVTMFFTFWGLNVLRKSESKSVKKPFIDKMFGFMMPKGSRKLKLSKMNMGGMGTAMMKKVMNDKNVDSLEALMQKAMKNGVKLVACTMSMDIMGITKEELIDGVQLAGVASYLGDAEESNVNLFI
jgi:peroxiredoxin family protein/TusA-related sulfurtransferase